MPYRELTMIDVKEVLRRWSAGQSDRRINPEAGIDRKTVARYTDAATRLGLARDRQLPDDEGHRVAQCAQSRPSAAPSRQRNDPIQHRAPIARRLARNARARTPPTTSG